MPCFIYDRERRPAHCRAIRSLSDASNVPQSPALSLSLSLSHTLPPIVSMLPCSRVSVFPSHSLRSAILSSTHPSQRREIDPRSNSSPLLLLSSSSPDGRSDSSHVTSSAILGRDSGVSFDGRHRKYRKYCMNVKYIYVHTVCVCVES